MTLNSRRKYKVSWNNNGKQAAAAQLTYYGKESEFKIYCSMENLTFIGITFPIPKIMLSLILLNILVNKKIPLDCSNRFQIF
jgi:hypothetical protein